MAAICSSRRGAPVLGDAAPVHGVRGAAVREGVELGGDLVEAEADVAGRSDEGEPAQDRPGIAALAAGGPGRLDEALLLVEPQRRRGEAAAVGHLGDGEWVLGHADDSTLDFKST